MEASSNSSNHGNNNDTAVDIPEDDLDPHCCIYRVPKRLREVNPDAYVPQLVSIGPLHHGEKELVNMEKQKRRYLQKFQNRMATSRPDALDLFRSFIGEKERDIRNCYAEFPSNEGFESQAFVEMVLNDSVFVIELFLRNFKKEENDFLLDKQWLAKGLWRDLILLENQIPYFVIDGLYKIVFPPENNTLPSFLRLACSYMRIDPKEISGEETIRHLTDMERQRLVRKVKSINALILVSKQYTENLYSASALHEAGVKFQAVRDPSLLDIKFENRKLHIPTITFLQSSEVYFRNLMALEQCHYQDEAFVCGYVDFMNYLINSEQDVRLLVGKGIVVNTLGSPTAVIDMIGKLRRGIVQVPLYYRKMGRDLNRFHDGFWNRSMANLRHVYFSNLWRGTATVAAFIVVLLTIVQTGLAILDQVRPTG